ncbi:hypothetical protein [Falsiporphyromonas endometrii]|uniref:DRTGG domain-containing protein n=1 Tax=Falsiporphyromonas endometrii TaxID=1387297 RepID=A0ABV9K8X5_9PORP
MPFIEQLVKNRSVSIVGMSKNAGKTECLNYVLKRLDRDYKHLKVCLTSIGIDGEKRDQVTETDKPEINLTEGKYFVTSEKHFLEKRLTAEIIDVDNQWTALGRLITAKVVEEGKLLISGPSSTDGLRRLIERTAQTGIDLTIVDGALSRLSLASPTVSESMILATGAAVSANIPDLVRQTKALYRLICLPAIENKDLVERLLPIEQGIWGIDKEGFVHDLDIKTALMIPKSKLALLKQYDTIYVSGAVNDKLLEQLRVEGLGAKLIVRDFTRIFASPKAVDLYLHSGAAMEVLFATKLIALTINPQSPDGYLLNSNELKEELQKALGIPVYDVRQI